MSANCEYCRIVVPLVGATPPHLIHLLFIRNKTFKTLLTSHSCLFVFIKPSQSMTKCLIIGIYELCVRTHCTYIVLLHICGKCFDCLDNAIENRHNKNYDNRAGISYIVCIYLICSTRHRHR